MLDQQEAFHAGLAGFMRNWHSKRIGSKHKSYKDPEGIDDWSGHINAAIAEAMVAKMLNKFWYRVSSNQYQYPGDVGDVQVRWTKYTNGHLLVYDADNSAQRVYLVVGAYPTMRVAGSIMIGKAKKPEYFRQDAGYYWIPQDKLEALDGVY